MSAELSDLDLADFEKQTSMAGNKRNSDTAGIDSNKTLSPDETDHQTKKPQVKKCSTLLLTLLLPIFGQCLVFSPSGTLQYLYLVNT